MVQHLTKSLGLTDEQLTAIGDLEDLCNQADGLSLKFNPNMLRDRAENQANDFLYYDDAQLIGYLALYSFNTREVEISAMTHPAYRRQGIFKHLLAAAREEVRQRSVPDLLFICERASPASAPTMQAISAAYDFSEHKMVLTHAPQSIAWPANLALRDAQLSDIEEMARMDALCFQTDLEPSRTWLETVLTNDSRRAWIATLNGRTIGKIQISLAGGETYINAFCILPAYRGRGYGKAILSHIVAHLLAEKHPLISLEVETENESALSLYYRAGFEVTTAYDYYRLPVT